MTPEEAKNELSNYRDKPFREHQEEAVDFILGSTQRFVFLCAPTGSGKSLIAMTAGMASGSCTYAVHSKPLQNQITTDFPEAMSLFGRSNYPCLNSISDLSCDECSHTRNSPCSLKRTACKYELAKRNTLAHNLRILNYDYLLTEANYVGRFSDPLNGFNIIDEADNLENTLINFCSLTLTDYALKRLGMKEGMERLHKTGKDTVGLIASWVDFAQEARYSANRIVSSYSKEIAQYPQILNDYQARTVKELSRIKRLLESINIFIDNVDPTWLMDSPQEGKYIFRPLWMTEDLADKFLWRHAKKWILMSASFLPIKIESKRLGVPMDALEYKDLPSTFSASRRPIFINGIANLSAKTMEEEAPKLTAEIKKIVDIHPDVKGLVHGVSYKLANRIMDDVDSPRLITHNSKDRQEVLDRFISSPEPLVLVSPSMDRGVSFEQDLCRFIVVAKAPYLSLGDRVVAARLYSKGIGSQWYTATMLLTVLQMTGRGFRSADDYCENYILDEQFSRALLRRPSYLPEWWKEALIFS